MTVAELINCIGMRMDWTGRGSRTTFCDNSQVGEPRDGQHQWRSAPVGSYDQQEGFLRARGPNNLPTRDYESLPARRNTDVREEWDGETGLWRHFRRWKVRITFSRVLATHFIHPYTVLGKMEGVLLFIRIHRRPLPRCVIPRRTRTHCKSLPAVLSDCALVSRRRA